MGPEVEKEKDNKLNVFMAFASDFCRKIRAAGYWAGACCCVLLQTVCETYINHLIIHQTQTLLIRAVDSRC